MDADIFQNLNRAVFLRYFDHRHVGGEGVRALRQGVAADKVQGRFLSRRQLLFVVGRGGNLGKGHSLIWVLAIESPPILNRDIFGRASQQMRGDGQQLFPGLFKNRIQGATPRDQTPAARGPTTVG